MAKVTCGHSKILSSNILSSNIRSKNVLSSTKFFFFFMTNSTTFFREIPQFFGKKIHQFIHSSIMSGLIWLWKSSRGENVIVDNSNFHYTNDGSKLDSVDYCRGMQIDHVRLRFWQNSLQGTSLAKNYRYTTTQTSSAGS